MTDIIITVSLYIATLSLLVKGAIVMCENSKEQEV